VYELEIACSMHGGMRNVHKIFVGESEDNRTFGRLRQKWEDNAKEHLLTDCNWVRDLTVPMHLGLK
jgi:hypothetical protein